MTSNDRKKEYLKSYRNLFRKIKSLESQLQEIRELKSSAGAIVYDDMPKGTHQGDLSDYAVKIDQLATKIYNYKMLCLDRKIAIESSIADMQDGLESEILRMKYIEFFTWESICVSIDYSWKHTHRLHSNALKNFEIKEDIE